VCKISTEEKGSSLAWVLLNARGRDWYDTARSLKSGLEGERKNVVLAGRGKGC